MHILLFFFIIVCIRWIDSEWVQVKKYIYMSAIIMLIGLMFPSQNVILTMYAAKHMTPHNIEQVKESGKYAAKFLLDEIFDRINEEGKEK